MDYSYALFRGDDRMFKTLSWSCSSYFEFGSGDSTIWMSCNSSSHIRSIETSRAHANLVRAGLSREIDLEVADIGPVEEWGRPVGYSRREMFRSYCESFVPNDDGIWPDLVLIDGRFRVACFLATLRVAPVGTRILFDDFKHRAFYHVVEDWVNPVDFCGEQALFVVDSFDQSNIEQELDRFIYVMD
jgi:hypothetical protein